MIRFGMDEGIYTHEGNEHVPTWNHEIILEELSENRCRYTDKVEITQGMKLIELKETLYFRIIENDVKKAVVVYISEKDCAEIEQCKKVYPEN